MKKKKHNYTNILFNYHLLKICISILLFGIIYIQLEKLLVPKWHYDINGDEAYLEKYRTFFDLPENTLDVLILGTSHSYFGIYPPEIYNLTGYTCYSLGGSEQSLAISYYLLREACKTQSPQYLILDMSSLFNGENQPNDELTQKQLIYLPFSFTKLEAMKACKNKDSSLFNYMFPLFTFHSRWNQLTSDDFFYAFSDAGNDHCSLGAHLNFNQNSHTTKQPLSHPELYMSDEFLQDFYTKELKIYDNFDIYNKSYKPTSQNIKYFNAIYSYCISNGIQLIPVKVPSIVKWDKEKYTLSTEFLSEYSLPFIDMTFDPKYQVNIDWTNDTCDSGNHLNYWGAKKVSSAISSYLMSLNSLNDHRNDPTYEVWNEYSYKYIQLIEDQLKTPQDTAYQYLETLTEIADKHLIIISVRDEATNSWSDTLNAKVKSLHLTSEFYNNYQNSFIAVIDKGNVIFEKWAEAPLIYRTSFGNNQHTLLSFSGGFPYGNDSQIIIDGIDYSTNNRGLNIVVYSYENEKVELNFSIDTWSPTLDVELGTQSSLIP